MAYDTNNIFAKILRGEIPCIKLYEDALTLAFMDIMPQTEGHALVIPKEPATTIFELSDEAAAACMATVRRIGNARHIQPVALLICALLRQPRTAHLYPQRRLRRLRP